MAMAEAVKNFDPRNLLLIGALLCMATAVGLYVGYQKHYQQILKCYTDTADVASAKPCKKFINKSQMVPDMSLDQSKLVCQENDTVIGFDWNPTASVFYDGAEDKDGFMSTGHENEKCDKKLTESQGTGPFIACVKVPNRKRGYFIGAIVMAAVAVIMLLTWVCLWKVGA